MSWEQLVHSDARVGSVSSVTVSPISILMSW